MIVNSKFSSLYLGRKENWKAPLIRMFVISKSLLLMKKYAFSLQAIQMDLRHIMKIKGDKVAVEVELIYTDAGYDGKRLYETVFCVETEDI